MLQAALAAVAVVQVLRCAGPAHVWVLVGLAVPLLRLGADAAYRRRARAHVRREWSAVTAFAADARRLPWRAAVVLVVVPAGLFFLSHRRPLMTGDSKPAALTAAALVRDGTTDLGAFVPLYAPVYRTGSAHLPYFLRRTASGVHSAYPSGVAVFALPPALLARLLGADLGDGGVQDRLEKSAASALAAACLGLFFLLALHLADAPAVAWMTLLLTTGSGVCSTVGQALWQHGGVLFWMLLALLTEFRARRRPRPAGSALQGVCLAMAFACRLPSAVLIAAFGVWLLLRAPRRALLVGLAAVLAYLPWAWYYHATYGNALGPSVRQSELFTADWRDTLLPLLVSPDHGLLTYQPWVLLGLAAVVPAVRRRMPAVPSAPGGWGWLCAASVLPSLALIASWYCWWGGQCWGSRLLVETVPYLGLLCLRPVAGLIRLRWGRRLVAAAALAAACVQLPGVYLHADCRDTQPALFGTHPEPPGSWKHLPFLTPFVSAKTARA